MEAKRDSFYGADRIRSTLNHCEFLAAVKSLDAEAKSVINFAIRAAPTGGACAGELITTFGVTRWRFMQMIREALASRPGDGRNARALKRNLLDALTWAWHDYPDSSDTSIHR
jgi:hypothetical protein